MFVRAGRNICVCFVCDVLCVVVWCAVCCVVVFVCAIVFKMIGCCDCELLYNAVCCCIFVCFVFVCLTNVHVCFVIDVLCDVVWSGLGCAMLCLFVMLHELCLCGSLCDVA